jgi:pimeloyl-ACP methyl ester carboxylesterase
MMTTTSPELHRRLARRPALRRLSIWCLRIALVMALLLTPLIGMVGALLTFYASAPLTDPLGPASVWVMLALATIALLLIAGAAAFSIAGGLGIRQRRRFARIVAGGTLSVLAVLVGVVMHQPPTAPESIPQPRPDTRYWDLPTGSHLAYTHFSALGTPHPTPIIFLHGGPGSPLRDPDYAFYRQLTRDRFDVYLYDQVGSGLSERLPNVRDYTTSRHVADLEAIRQQIGAAQMVVIGQSWGATLAADYMAAFPEYVAKVIFASPGAIWDVGRFTFDYSQVASGVGSDPALPPLRVLAAMILIGRNPDAALALAAEREVENAMDSLPSTSSLSQNYCKGDEARVPLITIRGRNQYVNRVTMASQERYPDPRPALRHNPTPALILRGACDFVPPAVAAEYQQTLSHATLVPIAGAGHALFGAQSERTLQAMRAFLLDQPAVSK